jgi:CYTH domain-containing protein
MSPRGIEIERKFRLRAAPDRAELAAHGAVAKRIEQVYLRNGAAQVSAGGAAGDAVADPDTTAERVRRIQLPDGTVSYRRTTKRRVGAFSFDEAEDPITGDQWEAALARADPERRPIRKTRHVVAHGPQTLEIDVFDEPPGLVVVEVELRAEDEAVELPGWLGEWREVTGDPRYLNVSLARRDARVPPFAA